MTLGPATQISPSVSAGRSCFVSGSKIFTVTLCRGVPTQPRRRVVHWWLPTEMTGDVSVSP